MIDPRSLVPLDEAAILASVRRTGRLVVVDESRLRCSAASEICALVTEAAFDALKAPPRRVTVPDIAVPYAPALEKLVVPDEAAVMRAVQGCLGGRVPA